MPLTPSLWHNLTRTQTTHWWPQHSNPLATILIKPTSNPIAPPLSTTKPRSQTHHPTEKPKPINPNTTKPPKSNSFLSISPNQSSLCPSLPNRPKLPPETNTTNPRAQSFNDRLLPIDTPASQSSSRGREHILDFTDKNTHVEKTSLYQRWVREMSWQWTTPEYWRGSVWDRLWVCCVCFLRKVLVIVWIYGFRFFCGLVSLWTWFGCGEW